MGNKNKR